MVVCPESWTRNFLKKSVMIPEYPTSDLNCDAPFSRPIFGRVIYSVYISLCDVHECKLFITWLQWLIQLASSVENRTREAQTKLKTMNGISEEKGYIAVYKCTPHRWVDDKNRCFLLSVLIFRQIQKPSIHKYALFFSGFFFAWDRKTSHLSWWVSCCWFPFDTLFYTYSSGYIDNYFRERCDEACTIKTEEINNTRRLYCLEAWTTRQSLYKQSFRRRKMYCMAIKGNFQESAFPQGTTRKPQRCGRQTRI